MEAVRVPPSACSTSQSITICFSPSAERSVMARKDRPTSRWISCVRPDCLPCAASRRIRLPVERGSIPYSAVTQPLPVPLRKPGTPSSRLAVTSTWVSPNFTRQEPSACLATPRSRLTGRISSGARLLGRIFRYLELGGFCRYLAFPGHAPQCKGGGGRSSRLFRDLDEVEFALGASGIDSTQA